ncbi:MAG: hypothetical protein ACK5TH_07005 [Prosthecobacter sp.]|jgi:hypothetical protein
MKNWKTKFFGDNAFNFYGWNFAAVLVLVGSVRYVLAAARAESAVVMQRDLLIAIYIVLLGCFGLLLQNYLARLAAKLEEKTKSLSPAPDHE